MNDRTALHKMQAGSQEALIWVMDTYGGYVSTIVWNIIGNTLSVSDAEEVVSDVFLALWTNASVIRTSSIKSYLAGIARNKAKMKLREAGHRPNLEESMITLTVPSSKDACIKKELALHIRQSIDRMKEPDREILLRYYYCYQTMDAISAEMGINLSTVKTKIRRGKESIKAYLISKFNIGGSL